MSTLLFDTRNHLPSRPLKGWSHPVVDPTEPDAYRIDTPDFMILAHLHRARTAHTLIVALCPFEGDLPLTDESVERVLRRFRCRGRFVEERHPPSDPRLRVFYARAKLGTPERWPKVERREDRFDARNHLPRDAPEGWSPPTTDPDMPDGYRIDAGELAVLVRLQRGGHGRGWELFVGVMRIEGTRPVTDPEAEVVLSHFRAHGEFEERSEKLGRPMPWVRAFFARADEGSPTGWAEVQHHEKAKLRSIPPRGWLILERGEGKGVLFGREDGTLRMRARWIDTDDFRLTVWHDGGHERPTDAEVKEALARNRGDGEVFEEVAVEDDAPEAARSFRRRATPTLVH